LARIPHQAATHSLVRHAVWSPWPNVRAEATRRLQWRSPEQYVPLLIEYLRPTDSGEVWRADLGQVWYWQDFATTYVSIDPPSQGRFQFNPVSGRMVSNRRVGSEVAI